MSESEPTTHPGLLEKDAVGDRSATNVDALTSRKTCSLRYGRDNLS